MNIKYFADNIFNRIMQYGNYTTHQNNIINHIEFNKFTIIGAPRQSFKTTTIMIYLLYKAITESNKKIVIVSHNIRSSESIIEEINYVLEKIPKHLNPIINRKTKQKIELGNGTEIQICSSDLDALRGLSVDYLILDELAYSKNGKMSLNIIEPCVKPNGKLIIISSLKHGSEFNNILKQSLEYKNHYKSMIIPWNFIPERNGIFKEKIISQIGIDRFNEEYNPESIFKINKNIEINDDDEIARKYLYSIDIGEGISSTILTAFSRDVSIKDNKLIIEFVLLKDIWNFIKSDEYSYVQINAIGKTNIIIASSKIYINTKTKQLSFVNFNSNEETATFKVTYDIIRQEAI